MKKAYSIVLFIAVVEQFKFVEGDWEHGQMQLRRAANAYRQALPHLRLGFYNIMPRCDYWTPILYRNQPHRLDYKARFEAWEKHNSLFKADRRDSLDRRSFDGLSDLVDFVSPSLYSPTLSMDGNRTYLIENINPSCNLHKSDRTTLRDETGNEVRLFDPRSDCWREHFEWDDFSVHGLTDVGKALIVSFQLNAERKIKMSSKCRSIQWRATVAVPPQNEKCETANHV